jgi:hypothetical protein
MASDFQRSARCRETRTSSSEDDHDSAAQGFDYLLSRDCTNTYRCGGGGGEGGVCVCLSVCVCVSV